MQEQNKIIHHSPKIRRIEIEEVSQESNLRASESMSIDEEVEPEIEAEPFLNFVSSYSAYINDTDKPQLDLTIVLNQLNETLKVMKPPSQQESIINFHQQLLVDTHQVDELAVNLQKLPNQQLYRTIQNIEKLSYKLNHDFEQELLKGKALGLLD